MTHQALETNYEGRSPRAFKFAKAWHKQAKIAKAYLDQDSKKMKKFAYKKRREVIINVGDMVMVKLIPQQFKSLRKVYKGSVWRYKGPFPILKKVRKDSYKVHLPPKLKNHSVFHVSLLKPYYKDMDDPTRGE